IRWTCGGTAPQVCLHPAFVGSREALDADFRSVYRRLDGTPFAFTRVEQRPRGIGSRTDSSNTVAFAIDDPVHADYADAVVDVAANALTGGQQCVQEPDAAPSSTTGIALEQVLVAWAAGFPSVVSSGDPAATAAFAEYTALSGPAQRAWLALHVDAVRHCTLTSADFR
ncbi:MAG TPA: hypothetical protein VLM05_14340, partial [Mycobacteriales bacterium]|nr:hypothetical protein [Mycobacteriales bacterium]